MKNKFSHFLVTGANGFVGKRFCQHLKNLGIKVTAVLKNKVENNYNHPWDQVVFHKFGNSENYSGRSSLHDSIKNIKDQDIDVIVHLANIAHIDRELDFVDYWESNVRSTIDLLDFAHSLNINRFLYLSSIRSVKGNQNDKFCLDESYTAWPNKKDLYGNSKRIAENLLLREAFKYNDLHVSILRPALIYGPQVKGHINLLVKAAKRQLLPKLPNIKNKVSMVHIDDLIDAMLLSINDPKANKKIFIVADKIHYSTRQICDHIKNQIVRKNYLNPLFWLGKVTIPYWSLQIIAKINDILKLICIQFGKSLAKNFIFDSSLLKKMFSSSCFSSKQIQQILKWDPKHTFWDYKID